MKIITSGTPLRQWAVAWQLALGRPGLLGLVLVALAVYAVVVQGPALRQEQRELLARQQEAAREPVVSKRRLTPASTAPQLLDSLPSASQRGADLARLIEISRRTEVELTRGDYSIEKLSASNEPGAQLDNVSQWRLQLPVRGSYKQLRRFIAELLNSVPHAALDGLQIDRPDTQQPWLETTLRVTLYYRGDGS
ncbi:putative transmembrane protein [Leptothrix cholodnii SP-6]|uniref:Putative transmembrane protein n=1 Tax=Leptothrix cholodnii (strain ATCC 51168 / LMG 8142 / SP-6) TaxID=395495 RepID=B1Y7C7_LEPCP|nr:GspMb/PilO family protein [Leptothrix cholodnii]ACB34882.1 putative transmembrane protein [Leptothrix cholodnii SP-6]